MNTPPYDRSELKQGLPLAGTPTPTPSPSSNPEAKGPTPPQKRVLVIDEDVDDLRFGHVARLNPADILAEMKAATAAKPPLPPSPAPSSLTIAPTPIPSPSSVVRNSSTYFTTNAPTPSHKKRPLVINQNQDKNKAILRYLSHVQIEWSSTITPDFIFTPTACGFFLSMKWHRLNSHYLSGRVHEVKNCPLRIVICHIDIPDPETTIRDLSQNCLNLNVTLLLAWSHKEAARYIETLKAYEGRPATMLQERVEESEKHADVLQVVRFINKTDVQTLAHTFGTLKRIANATMEELSLCPGLGTRKVQKLHAAFTDPLDPAVGRKKQKSADIAPYLSSVRAAPEPYADETPSSEM